MLVTKLILGLSSIGIIAGCSTLHGPADGCSGYPDQKIASAKSRSELDAARLYYSPDSQNGKTEDPDYIGTPGYYAVNGLQHPSPEQVSKQASSQDPRPAALTRAPSRTYYYKIEPGDTIYSLARKHCVSMQDIRTVNKLNRKFEIRAGDVILLPKDRCKI